MEQPVIDGAQAVLEDSIGMPQDYPHDEAPGAVILCYTTQRLVSGDRNPSSFKLS
jgi:hypothetical protein